MASHGWSAAGIDVFEMSATEPALSAENANTLFHPSEIELSQVTRRLFETIDRVKPARVVFDSLSEVRLLSGEALHFRREILTLKARLAEIGATTLLLDDQAGSDGDRELQSLAHGVILMLSEAPPYGAVRRRMQVVKLRGVSYSDGLHDYRLLTGGIELYPRLVAIERAGREFGGPVPSGNTNLDALVGGGVDRGSSVLLVGPAGVGKSTVALSFAVAAAERGEKSRIYTFDESRRTLRMRARGLGIELEHHEAAGLIAVHRITPAQITPGQFARMLLASVERDGASLIMIDGLNGYLSAMPRDDHLMLHLHELLATLNDHGVTTFLTVAQHGMVGSPMEQPVDASYLADTVILFRYYETDGEVRQAVSVVKRRGGGHERTIRQLTIAPPRGVIIGEPVMGFDGVLTGVPTLRANLKREPGHGPAR